MKPTRFRAPVAVVMPAQARRMRASATHGSTSLTMRALPTIDGRTVCGRAPSAFTGSAGQPPPITNVPCGVWRSDSCRLACWMSCASAGGRGSETMTWSACGTMGRVSPTIAAISGVWAPAAHTTRPGLDGPRGRLDAEARARALDPDRAGVPVHARACRAAARTYAGAARSGFAKPSSGQ